MSTESTKFWFSENDVPNILPEYTMLKYRADDAYFRKDFENALRFYQSCQDSLPPNSIALWRSTEEDKARCHLKLDHTDEALHCTQNLMKVSQNIEQVTSALNLLLDVHEKADNIILKISTLKKLLLLHSHCARWWDMLGDAYSSSSVNRDMLNNASNISNCDQIHSFGSSHVDKSSECFNNHTELKVEETKQPTKSEGILISCPTEEVKPHRRTKEGIKLPCETDEIKQSCGTKDMKSLGRTEVIKPPCSTEETQEINLSHTRTEETKLPCSEEILPCKTECLFKHGNGSVNCRDNNSADNSEINQKMGCLCEYNGSNTLPGNHAIGSVSAQVWTCYTIARSILNKTRRNISSFAAQRNSSLIASVWRCTSSDGCDYLSFKFERTSSKIDRKLEKLHLPIEQAARNMMLLQSMSTFDDFENDQEELTMPPRQILLEDEECHRLFNQKWFSWIDTCTIHCQLRRVCLDSNSTDTNGLLFD